MNYFLCKVKYQKINEQGRETKVTEAYLVDAMSFTEAESRLNKNLEEYIAGEFIIHAMGRSNISEVVKIEGDILYNCKISYLDIDDQSGKGKKTNMYLLVPAKTVEEAALQLHKHLETMIVPYEVVKVEDSNIIDVFEYNN